MGLRNPNNDKLKSNSVLKEQLDKNVKSDDKLVKSISSASEKKLKSFLFLYHKNSLVNLSSLKNVPAKPTEYLSAIAVNNSFTLTAGNNSS